jgi:hypothetical protein
MEYEICNMICPIITDFDWLSNITIKVYDFCIIMYFYIGANYAKQSQFCAFFTPKRRFHEKTNPIQTQFKANKAKNKPNLTQYKANFMPKRDRTEIRCGMFETTYLWQLQFKTVFYIIIVLLDYKTLKS